MSNQKFNALEVPQKEVLLEKFANYMALIVAGRGVIGYGEAKKDFLEFFKGRELKNFPFSNTKYEDAWDVFLKGHYQEEASLKNLDLIVANLHDLQSCRLLEKKLNERKKDLEFGKKNLYFLVSSDVLLGIFKTCVEASNFLSEVVKKSSEKYGDAFFVERLNIYTDNLYEQEYKENLKKTRNNDLDYAVIAF